MKQRQRPHALYWHVSGKLVCKLEMEVRYSKSIRKNPVKITVEMENEYHKMVLIFALNGKPSSPNTTKGKLQADRLLNWLLRV